MKRAVLWAVAAFLVVGLVHAEDRKNAVVAPPSADRAAAVVRAGDVKGGDALSLVYVPRDALVLVAFRPPALLKCPAFAPLGKLITERLELDKQVGFSLESIEQVLLAFMLVEGPALNGFKLPNGSLVVMGDGGRVTRPEPVVAVLQLATSDNADSLAAAIQPDAEKREYAGRTYFRGSEDGNRPCVLVDGRTLVAAEEPYLRRSIVAGRDGASKAKWARTWQAAAGADVAALMNVAAIRNLLALEAKEPGVDASLTIRPPAAAPLFDSTTALLSVNLQERIAARLQLSVEEGAEVPRIQKAFKAFADLHRAALSTLRAAASSDASDNGAALLESLDNLDAALDSLTIEMKDRSVEASLAISLEDTTKAVLAWINTLEDDKIEGAAVDDDEDLPVP